MGLLSYAKTIWKAGKGGGTPISPANLNNIENGIEQAIKQINDIDDRLQLLSEWQMIGKSSLSGYEEEIVIPSSAKELVIQVYNGQINHACLWYFPKKNMLLNSGNRYFPQGGNSICFTINVNQARVKIHSLYYATGTLLPKNTSLYIWYK